MTSQEQGADTTNNRWLVIPRTLCFILNGDDVLLMKRASHRRIFPNRYNGVGGHIERNEDPLSGVMREIQEETGLTVHSVVLRSIHNIDVGVETGIILFVYTAVSDSRAFVDNGDEGTLHWIPIDRILELDLAEDLPIILPRVLGMRPNDSPFFVHVSYDNEDVIQLRFAGG